MVRRELGADRADLPGLSVGTRALHLAHLLQYQDHLDDALDANRNTGFPAAARFTALPPAGPMPPGMIDTTDFTQRFFPAEIDCELAPIPADELPALIDEALALPAIDLTVPPELLDSTSVLILAPVPRDQWRTVVQKLKQNGIDSNVRRLLPAASNRLAARKPLQIVQRLKLPPVIAQPVSTSDPRELEWARLAKLPELWFVRRRNLAYRDDLAGAAVRFAGIGTPVNPFTGNTKIIGGTPIIPQNTDPVMQRATPDGAAAIATLLASVSHSPAFTAAVLGELARCAELDKASVFAVAAKVCQPGLGTGLERFDALPISDNAPLLRALSHDGEWRDTDALARTAGSSTLQALAAALVARGEALPPIPSAPVGLARAAAPKPRAQGEKAPRARAKRVPRAPTAVPASKLRH
jgi:hypothetical protein